MNKETIITLKNKLMDKKEWIMLIFLFSFSLGYILLFTQCVPFFFDDHEFHRNYVQQTYTDFFEQIFSFNHGGISDGSRPVYGIYFKTLFPFFGYDYCAYRVVKGLIFVLLIFLIYVVATKTFENKRVALFFAVYHIVLFPTYLQTFGYNGPHIIAEVFKISAILLFLKDIEREKTSWTVQLLIFFFALLAVRTYPPAYSVAGILILFTVLFDRKKVKRYAFLFIVIILIQFPITMKLGALDPNSNGTYGPKLANIRNVFLNDFVKNITSPIPSLDSLYYKSFTAIVTFFGFWLLIVCLLLYILSVWKLPIGEKYFVSPKEESGKHIFKEKKFFCLAAAWMLSELPTYIFLPEHAIRYMFAFFIPFSIMMALFIEHVRKNIAPSYKKRVTLFILLMIVAAMLTNIAYVTAFRAGWGSSFFTFEKGMDYFAAQHTGQKIAVLYASGSVADEYFYVNKSSSDYTFGTGITYMKMSSWTDFSEDTLKKLQEEYDEVYVTKRITSVSKAAYPDIPFEEYEYLKLQVVLEGTDSSVLFDNVLSRVVSVTGVSYQANKLFIYKFDFVNSSTSI